MDEKQSIEFVRYDNMIWKRLFWVLILLLFIKTIVFAQQKIVLTSSPSQWKLSGVHSSVPIISHQGRFEFTCAIAGNYREFDTPFLSIQPQIQIEASTNWGSFSYGNIFDDRRIAIFSHSGFSVKALSIHPIGPIRVDAATWNEDDSWTFSHAIDQYTWLHLFSYTEHAGMRAMGIGFLLEHQQNGGTYRLGSLYAFQQQILEPAFMYPYGAYPVGDGYVVYGSYNTEEISLCYDFSLQHRLLVRFSRDRSLGSAVALSYDLFLISDIITLSFQEKLVPLWTGGIGNIGYTTVDAPLRKGEYSAEFRYNDLALQLSCTDTWWRPTAYAGNRQRRHLKAEAKATWKVGESAYSIGGECQHKDNRLGSQSQTYQFSCAVQTTVASTRISCKPFIRWGKKWSFGAAVDISHFISEEMEIALYGDFTGSVLQSGYSITLAKAFGEISIGLSAEGKFTISCSIGQGG